MRWAFLSYRALTQILAGEFEQAAKWAYKATRVPNCHYWPFAHRVVALAHGHNASELAAAVADLLQRKPDFSQAMAERQLFYIKDSKQIALYIDGLRKAGLPRTPKPPIQSNDRL